MRGVGNLQCHGADEGLLENETQGAHQRGLIETCSADRFAERGTGSKRR